MTHRHIIIIQDFGSCGWEAELDIFATVLYPFFSIWTGLWGKLTLLDANNILVHYNTHTIEVAIL